MKHHLLLALSLLVLLAGCRFVVDWHQSPCTSDNNCPLGWYCGSYNVADGPGHCVEGLRSGDDDTGPVPGGDDDDDDTSVADDDDDDDAVADDDDEAVADDDDSGAGDDDTPEDVSSCQDYCTAVAASSCTSLLNDVTDCESWCQVRLLDRGTGTSALSSSTGNTLGCRIHHLAQAQSESSNQCSYAGILGGSNSAGYLCVADLAWPLCQMRAGLCHPDHRPYPSCLPPGDDDFATCMSEMSTLFPLGSSGVPIGSSSTAPLECRLHQLGSWQTQADLTPGNILDNCEDSSFEGGCACATSPPSDCEELAPNPSGCDSGLIYPSGSTGLVHSSSTMTYSYTMAGSTEATDVDIWVNITAADAQMVSIRITDPEGPGMYLVNQQQVHSSCANSVGTCGSDFVGTIFDMSASIALEDACPPYNGRVLPVSTTDLTEFANEYAKGLWMLTVTNAGSQAITLDSWRIVVEDQVSCSL